MHLNWSRPPKTDPRDSRDARDAGKAIDRHYLLVNSTNYRIVIFVLLALAVMLMSMFSAGTSQSARAEGGLTPTPTVMATLRAVTLDEVNQASQNLYCPVCENLPLPVCPTVTCEEWRGEVRDLLAQGYSRAEIETLFVARYGEKAVGTPVSPGTQLGTVVLPITLIGVIGGLALFSVLRWRMKQPKPNELDSNGRELSHNWADGAMVGSGVQSTSSDRNELKDDYRAQLEAELRKRE